MVANNIRKRQVSFDKPVGSDDGNSNLYDTLPSESLLAPDGALINESLSINIKRAMAKLSQRESDVLSMSFGLESKTVWSLSDIAIKYDISSERVRQIRTVGLLKLRQMLENKVDLFED